MKRMDWVQLTPRWKTKRNDASSVCVLLFVLFAPAKSDK